MVQGLGSVRLPLALLLLVGVMRGLAASVTFASPSSQEIQIPVVVDEAITVTEAPLSSGAVLIAVDESITVTDVSFSGGSAIVAIEESISVTDTFQPPVNSNRPPTEIALSKLTVAESQPIGTTVGTFSTTDPDAGNTHSYSLVSGSDDSGNASFSISGNVLKTAAVFDFETKSSYSIRVRATDSGSPAQFFEKSITITITDVVETCFGQPANAQAGVLAPT
jgi:hypothetical protein